MVLRRCTGCAPLCDQVEESTKRVSPRVKERHERLVAVLAFCALPASNTGYGVQPHQASLPSQERHVALGCGREIAVVFDKVVSRLPLNEVDLVDPRELEQERPGNKTPEPPVNVFVEPRFRETGEDAGNVVD